jgi:hypothetical protein
MRLLLLMLLVAVSTDAIRNNGAYTQAAWTEISSQIVVQAVNLTQRINERVQQEARVQKSGFVQR